MEEYKFAVDLMLGKLAKWLRLLGFDAVFLRNGPIEPYPDRILVTRRSPRPHQPDLSDHPRVVRIRSDHVRLQLAELISILNISPEDTKPFSRCSICNIVLREAEPGEIQGAVPEYVLNTRESFRICPGCRRVYWPATHRGAMAEELQKIFSRAGAGKNFIFS